MFFVGLGILGLVLPLLPTFPFLLLAAGCFAKSSPRFHSWLLNNRYVGRHIRDYGERRGLSLRAKIFAISLMWIVTGYSAIVALDNLHLRVFLFLLVAAVTVHIAKLSTVSR
ncbi:MAG: YbaN family protein [Chloroflexi bacterium]|nr:YbaN family protein [Chloroflexota bacterium]